jgi:hypothetical protein
MAAYNAVWTNDKRQDSFEIPNRLLDSNWIPQVAQEHLQEEELPKVRMFHQTLDSIFSGFSFGE